MQARPDTGQSLKLRQTQSTQLTAALQQAIKLLQLSAQNIDVVVREALEINPFLLQETPADAAKAPDAAEKRPRGGFRGGYLAPDPALSRMLGVRPAGRRSASSGAMATGAPSEDVAGRTTLLEHLESEISAAFEVEAERTFARELCGALDDAGYLDEPLEACAERTGIDAETAGRVLERLQAMEPAGLFARDLRECLALQLEDRGLLRSPMTGLLDNLELLAAGDLERLAETLSVDRERLDAMLGVLRSLDPRPGLRFVDSEMVLRIPDLVAVRDGDGWRVEVNSDLAPRLFVDRAYYDRIRSEARRDDKAYLSEQLRSAQWLIRALNHRYETVLTIAQFIVNRQSAFLDRGVDALQPLTLKDIAELAEMHESTVSRAVADKYLETPQGTLELRGFFSAAIRNSDGGPAHAARAVQARLGALIENEPTPLSDAELADLLRAEGVDIARRTVAKYREILGLPSSSVRRRQRRALESRS